VVLAPPPLAIHAARGFRISAIFQWWHLLSLDAPTVAALWAWGIARAVNIELPWSALLLLASGTWLVYVADRILDGLRFESSGQLRERHFFYARHRGKAVAGGVVVCLVLLWLIATRMNATARREDTALFAVALAYFCLVHLCRLGIERWFPKEAAVGALFALAVAVPAWSRLQGHRAALIPVVTLFALLCWLNCIAIEKWERPPGEKSSVLTTGLAHATTRWAQRHFFFVSSGIALLAAVACIRSDLSAAPVAMTALYLACTISAALFLALDRSRLSSVQLRIAADAILLTPLLFAVVTH
jgi:hypothetical protein